MNSSIVFLDNIPDEYKINAMIPSTPAATLDTGESMDTEAQAVRGARPKTNAPTLPNIPTATPAARTKRVKIKMTKGGLTFSGPSAYLSHMYRCDFVYQKNQYTSVEQGYHHIHALVKDFPDIAAKVLKIHNGFDLKDAVVGLPKSEKWSAMAPGKFWELNEAKFEQNPDLMNDLIATATHKLIEASVDSKWGGACRLGPIYTAKA